MPTYYWIYFSWIGMALICYLSLSQPSGEAGWWQLPYQDKLGHFFLYGLLYFPVSKCFSEQYKITYSMGSAFIWCYFFGGLMEVSQHLLTKYRQADSYDLMANTIGMGKVVVINLIQKSHV